MVFFPFILQGQTKNELHSKIKHVEIISEVEDTMALINKTDINKINKVFYEKECLDSLRVIDSCIIENHIELKKIADSIALVQVNTINNQDVIISQYKEIIESNNVEISDLEKKAKKDKNTKAAWQGVSGTLAVVVLILLLI